MLLCSYFTLLRKIINIIKYLLRYFLLCFFNNSMRVHKQFHENVRVL